MRKLTYAGLFFSLLTLNACENIRNTIIEGINAKIIPIERVEN